MKDVDTIKDVVLDGHWGGQTFMGRGLRKKILDPIFRLSDKIPKPILIITITDGAPDDKPEVKQAIHQGVDMLGGGLSLQFCQVGEDKAAQKWLAELDKDPEVGKYVDCTSSKLTSSPRYAIDALI